jgi:hypothetical protein
MIQETNMTDKDCKTLKPDPSMSHTPALRHDLTASVAAVQGSKYNLPGKPKFNDIRLPA